LFRHSGFVIRISINTGTRIIPGRENFPLMHSVPFVLREIADISADTREFTRSEVDFVPIRWA
jgi:hypothetical protein